MEECYGIIGFLQIGGASGGILRRYQKEPLGNGHDKEWTEYLVFKEVGIEKGLALKWTWLD